MAIANMKALGMTGVMVEQQMWNNDNGTLSMIDGYVNLFKNYESEPNFFNLKVNQTFQFSAINPVTDIFTSRLEAAGASILFSYDSRYYIKKVLEFSPVPSNGYTKRGEPKEFTDQSGVVTKLEWYENEKAGLLKKKTVGNQITQYDYEPLVGVSAITDPNNFTTLYYYDGFNRLKEIKDHKGNLLQSFTYNLTNSEGCSTPSLTAPPTNGGSALEVSNLNNLQNVASGGGAGSFTITASLGWTISNVPSWASVSPTSGPGNQTVTVTFQPNSGSTSRSATLTITGGGLTQSVTLSQQGTTPSGGSGCGGRAQGLTAQFYHLGALSQLPNFATLTPVQTTNTANFDISNRSGRDEQFGFVFKGYIDIPQNGDYQFFTSSDDGSKLYIDDVLRVNNDGLHGMNDIGSGAFNLTQGCHTIRVEMFENAGGEGLEVRWQGPSISKGFIPNDRLYRDGSTPGGNCTPDYVSDLTWASSSNAWGPVEKDKSNGENASGDGRTLTLNGVTYAKGLGIHAASEVVCNLNGAYTRFKAYIGVDDEVPDNAPASVVFEVWADGQRLFQSATLRPTSTTVPVDVDVTGKQQLKLVVTDAGDGVGYDHADWAEARLEKACGSSSDTQAPTTPTNLSTSNVTATGLTLSWSASTDNVGVTGYEVYQGGAKIGETASTTFNVTGLTASTTYSFTVRAKDAAGNLSAASNPAAVTTPASGGGCTPTSTYVSDLTWASSSNAWGPVEKDKSNGEQGAGDGLPLKLNGQTYAKGLGVHAASEVVYNLGGQYTRFKSDLGVDDEVSNPVASVVFEVWADGQRLFQSATLRHDSPIAAVDVDVTGKQELKLVVTGAGDGVDSDHADWAGARLERSCTTPPPAGGSGTGLRGYYHHFSGTPTFNDPKGNRVDETIDFGWGPASPWPGQVNSDNFAVRWKGFVEVPTQGTYQFQVAGDDGIRAYWNNEATPIVDDWSDHGERPANFNRVLSLQAGTRYPITIEFYEKGGDAAARFRYQSGGTWLPVPKAWLYPEEAGQSGASLTVNRSTLSVDGSGASESVIVTANVGWSVSSAAGWITTSPGNGTNNGSFTLTMAANPGAARTGTVSVTGGGLTQTITINQRAACDTYTCPTFTEGQEIGRRGSSPGEKAIVRFVNGCAQVWWGDLSGRTNKDWLPLLNSKPHCDEILGSCLKWDGESCP